ncbi:acyltransferase [Agarivorans albus]
MHSLRGFDGMRALACLAVLAHHLAQRLDSHHWLVKGLHAGELGVSLFFVLSGALLAYPFWQAHFSAQTLPRIKEYIKRRAARIIPAYYLVLLVSVLLNMLIAPQDYALPRLLAGLSFIAPYHYISFFPNDINGPLWSIGLEVSCYLLLPLLLMPLWRRKTASLKVAMAWGVALLIVMQLLHYLIVLLFMTDQEGKGWQYGIIGGAKQWLPYWNVASFMGQFLCGVIAAAGIAWYEKQQQLRHYYFDLAFLGAFGLATWMSLNYLVPGAPSQSLGQAYLAPLFSMLCAVALLAAHFSRYCSWLLDNRLFSHIATLSFGIYLWHYLIMEIIRILWVPQYHYMGMEDIAFGLQIGALVVCLSWTIAALSFYLLEKPILNWARGSNKMSRSA